MMMGGFGLFLDPAGRPRGRRDELSPNSLPSSSSSLLWLLLSSRSSLIRPLVPLCSSSEV